MHHFGHWSQNNFINEKYYNKSYLLNISLYAPFSFQLRWTSFIYYIYIFYCTSTNPQHKIVVVTIKCFFSRQQSVLFCSSIVGITAHDFYTGNNIFVIVAGEWIFIFFLHSLNGIWEPRCNVLGKGRKKKTEYFIYAVLVTWSCQYLHCCYNSIFLVISHRSLLTVDEINKAIF